MARQRILVLNAGSSSLKLSLLESGRSEPVAARSVGWGSDATRANDRRASVQSALDGIFGADGAATSIAGVGHRVVHGGTRFRLPVVIDQDVLAELDALVELAPLHNAVALDTARAARKLLPDVPHVAVFDTAYHATLPEEAFVYPLPWRWYEEWHVRRYGFHGLSVEWSVRRAGELLDRPLADLALVVAHLGSGCSVTAVEGGRSVATSMGLTPLEGLMMGTRAGSFDPGVLLRLLGDGRLSRHELAEALDHQSGLLGVSGVSGDVRAIEAEAERGSARAALALRLFARRAAEGIAAVAVALPRLDAVVFTGGIGENAGGLRAEIVRRLGVLGVPEVTAEETGDDRVLSASSGGVAVLRVEAREDIVIAEAVAGTVSAVAGTVSAESGRE